jgi:hypothetical protein
MRLGALVSRIDRLAGRFNRWLGGAAVASNVQRPGSGSVGGSSVDPAAVVAVLREIEEERHTHGADGTQEHGATS